MVLEQLRPVEHIHKPEQLVGQCDTYLLGGHPKASALIMSMKCRGECIDRVACTFEQCMVECEQVNRDG